MIRYIIKLLILTLLLIYAQWSFANLQTESEDEIQNDSVEQKYWDIGGAGSLNVNQGYLANWVEGGESSINATWILRLDADYKKNKTVWDNDAEWKYGVLKSGNNDLRKNEDKFEFSSKFGYNASKKWYYTGLMNLRSQLFNGFDYPNDSIPVSAFMSPGNIVSSLGMDYKPNKNFNIMISPFSVKTTVVYDTVNIDPTKYGLDGDKRFRGEIGGYVTTKWKVDLHKSIVMTQKLELFSNYLYQPENIDINWEMSLVFRATKYIKTTISTHLIYDHDIDIPVYKMEDGEVVQDGVTKAAQFKELLSIGFSYKF